MSSLRIHRFRGGLATAIAWALGFSLAGCGGDRGPAVKAPVAESRPVAPAATTNGAVTSRREPVVDEGPVLHLAYAQPKLSTVRLRLGAHEMDAEVCRTMTQIATGLMFRPGIGPDDGMLFLFARPHQTAFYMKNVRFDIDAAYIGPDGVILEIVRLKAQDRTPVPAKSDQVQFVLETAPGYFERQKLGPGTLVMTAQGPLQRLIAGQ